MGTMVDADIIDITIHMVIIVVVMVVGNHKNINNHLKSMKIKFSISFILLLLTGCASHEAPPPILPVLSHNLIIEVVGMGAISHETFPNPVQANLMGKRAAVIDGYRQIGERIYGIRVNARETVKDMIAKNSTVRTCVESLIKNAEIVTTSCKDGECKAEMKVVLDQSSFNAIFPWRD